MTSIYSSASFPYTETDLNRKKGVLLAGRLMMNAAFTAPVAGGVPQIEAQLVWGDQELRGIARKMEEMAKDNPRWTRRFRYEAVMIEESDAVLFIGNYKAASTPMDSDCGLCGGVSNCGYFYERHDTRFATAHKESKRLPTFFSGPLCSTRVTDLGYAVGSALYMAHKLLVDCRPLMSAGLAGQVLGYCPESVIVVALPMAAIYKNPYVDINPNYDVINLRRVMETSQGHYLISRMIMTYDYRLWEPGERKPDSKEVPVKEEGDQ